MQGFASPRPLGAPLHSPRRSGAPSNRDGRLRRDHETNPRVIEDSTLDEVTSKYCNATKMDERSPRVPEAWQQNWQKLPSNYEAGHARISSWPGYETHEEAEYICADPF